MATTVPGQAAGSANGAARLGAYAPRGDRAAWARGLRAAVPRGAHAEWRPAPDRPDPVRLLEDRSAGSLARLVPIRRWRMAQSPFAFLRGSAVVMAHDLMPTPRTGIGVQACGDAHLSNFGVYATPERALVFDLNDFDESSPGPWEWDVKRLAASITVAGRQIGASAAEARDATLHALAAYRGRMAVYAEMTPLEVWYARIDEATLASLIPTKAGLKALRAGTDRARRRTGDRLAGRLVGRDDGGALRILADPPLIVPIGDDAEVMGQVEDVLGRYRQTLARDRRLVLDRYRVRDAALKVVGVGSVGTRCWIALMVTADDETLLLQVKEAGPSVLEGTAARRHRGNHGRRVVDGQRMTQAASDAFLGWMRTDDGRDYYVRQLRDMKLSAEIETMTPADLRRYAGLCGWALARAHARTGDPVAIAAYLGTGDRFDRAVADFAGLYADQTEEDHAALVRAISTGGLEAVEG